MITDEERRQIAYRLHEEAENWRDFAKDDTLFDMCDATFVESMLSAFQLNNMDMNVYKAFDKLTDIIDRPTCHDVGGGYEFRCSVCGCVIHIFRDGGFGEDDSAMAIGGDSLYVPHYCPNCGAEVVE